MPTVVPWEPEGEDFRRKEGDEDPFEDVLTVERTPGYGDFIPLDLTAYTTRKFKVASLTASGGVGALLFEGTADVVGDPTQGRLRYTPSAANVTALDVPSGSESAIFVAEWLVEKADGSGRLVIPRGSRYRRILVGKGAM